MWERRTFCAVCKSKPQKLPFNLLQNESSSDEKYCFTINSPLARTIFTLNNALPVEFLIDIRCSVNIPVYLLTKIHFKSQKAKCHWTLERSFVKIYPYGYKTSLPMLGKCVVEIYSNCTDKRTFATFHVIDAAASCILGKSTLELLFVLTVLQPTRYDQISVLTNSDLKLDSTVFYMSIKILLKARVL